MIPYYRSNHQERQHHEDGEENNEDQRILIIVPCLLTSIIITSPVVVPGAVVDRFVVIRPVRSVAGVITSTVPGIHVCPVTCTIARVRIRSVLRIVVRHTENYYLQTLNLALVPEHVLGVVAEVHRAVQIYAIVVSEPAAFVVIARSRYIRSVVHFGLSHAPVGDKEC